MECEITALKLVYVNEPIHQRKKFSRMKQNGTKYIEIILQR